MWRGAWRAGGRGRNRLLPSETFRGAVAAETESPQGGASPATTKNTTTLRFFPGTDDSSKVRFVLKNMEELNFE